MFPTMLSHRQDTMPSQVGDDAALSGGARDEAALRPGQTMTPPIDLFRKAKIQSHGKRTALWAHECSPPHRVTHPEKLLTIMQAIKKDGWDPTCPSLVAYQSYDGHIQLVSGSHRWAAAKLAGAMIPVWLYPLDVFEEAYGDLEMWRDLLASGD